MEVPPDADYCIIKIEPENAEEDWSNKGILPGDLVYFKQVSPATEWAGPFPFNTYDSPQEAMASKDAYPLELYEATMGKLFMWNPKEACWERRPEATIECMGWFAVNFKIYDVSEKGTADGD